MMLSSYSYTLSNSLNVNGFFALFRVKWLIHIHYYFIWDTFRYTLNCKFDPWKFCLDYLIGCLNPILALISSTLFIYACLMVPFIAKRRILYQPDKALAHLLSKSISNRNYTVRMYSMSPIWKNLAFIKVAIAIMIHEWDEFSSQMKRNSFRTSINALLSSGPCPIYESQIKWIYVLIKQTFFLVIFNIWWFLFFFAADIYLCTGYHYQHLFQTWRTIWN